MIYMHKNRVNMGQTLSEPNTNKTSSKDANEKYFYGCSHMQGWRLSNACGEKRNWIHYSNSCKLAMEDAHTTLLKLGDTNCSFFGVYDGHGGK